MIMLNNNQRRNVLQQLLQLQTIKKPRIVSSHEIARQNHNQKVQQSKASKLPLRSKFLKQNVELLKPFIDPTTYEQIKNNDVGVHPLKYTSPSSDLQQPKLISGGQLRDYQLDGLKFLVGHHRRNLAAILGDEMGLGT